MIRDQLLSIPMKKYLILMDFFTDHSLSERKRFVLRSLRAKETHQTLNFKTTTSEGKTNIRNEQFAMENDSRIISKRKFLPRISDFMSLSSENNLERS